MGLFNDLIKFIPGETAKAGDVNSNFNKVCEEIDSIGASVSDNQDEISQILSDKADKNGNVNEQFNVGYATSNSNAVNKGQLQSMLGGLLDYISGLYLTKDTGATFIVSKGNCYDTTHVVNMTLSEDLSVTIDDAQANSRYYVFIRCDDEDGTNTEIVTRLTSYFEGVGFYRCIGYVVTNNSNPVGIDSTTSYGTNNTGTPDAGLIDQYFNGMYSNLDNEVTLERNKIYEVKDGPGWVRWVCNENDTTRDLLFGTSSDSLKTVARVRAAASNDACGAAAFLPINKGMFFKCTKGDLFFSTTIGGTRAVAEVVTNA